jgi:putative heme transporter
VEEGLRELGLVPVAEQELVPKPRRDRRRLIKRGALIALSVGIIVATFAFFLPSIANYADVWKVVQGLSWQWIVALLVVTAINLATFAPPWMIALPGLGFIRAMELTQASTALTIVFPGGAAVGIAGSYGITRRWGFAGRDVARAVTLVSLWNQFVNLAFPIVAVFLLTTIEGEQSAALATAAFIGVAVLGVVVTGFVLVLLSNRLARDIGDVAARFTSWALGKIRRGPVQWGGESFKRFRDDVGDFLERKWPWLTLAALVGNLSVFAVLLVSLRALDVPASAVTAVEAFAAWALIRIIGSIPITPGGIGIIELGLTGALVGFGGANASVVAAVLVYRFLTVVPTLTLGLLSAFTFRRKGPQAGARQQPEFPSP